jgi:hypothetical protein
MLLSCTTGVKTISYKVYEGEKQFKHIYKLDIPKGYKLFRWTGGHEDQCEFWYPDSSVIYLTKNLGSTSINDKNIRRQENAYSKRFKAFLENDSITLSGFDTAGLYWKEIKLKSFCYGYAKVPKEKKYFFDKALSSLK